MSETTNVPAGDLRSRALSSAAAPRFAAVNWPGVGNVRVYSMTVGEKSAFERESSRRRDRDADNLRWKERLLIATVRDAEGKPLFSAADEAALSQLSEDGIRRVFNAALRLNGWADDQDDDEGDAGN